MTLPFRLARLTGSRRLLVAAVALMLPGLAALAAGAWTWGAPATAAAGSAAPSGVRQERQGSVQVVRFAVYDAGILPRRASVAHGRVLLSLTDYMGGSAGLVLERETAAGRERVGSVERESGGWRGRRELQLAPGTYRVSEARRPDLQATLVVEP